MLCLCVGKRRVRKTAVALASLALACIGSLAQAAVVTSGLIQDLNPEIGVTTSGSDVIAWANQAASGGDNVITNGGTVTLVPDAINGKSAISVSAGGRMAGSDTAAFSGLAGGTGYTWFAVVDTTPVGGNASIFGTLVDGAPYHGIIARVSPGSNVANVTNVYAGGPTVHQTVGTTDISVGGFQIIAGRLEAGSSSPLAEVFVNSPISEGSANVDIPGPTGAGVLTLGAERATGSEYWEGQIARILIYDRPLSLSELNETGLALAAEYGLTTAFVPEPSSVALIGMGLAGLGRVARRRR